MVLQKHLVLLGHRKQHVFVGAQHLLDFLHPEVVTGGLIAV
jgi:hypothetical protein